MTISPSGDVEWFDEAGTKLGATTFTLRGSVPAGDTKFFSVADGTMASTTLEAAAKTVRIKFSHVDIID